MKNFALAVPLLVLPLLASPEGGQDAGACNACDFANIDQAPKAVLQIRWKRAVVPAGEVERTAPRHAQAELALDAASSALARALTPLGVTVTLQKVALGERDVPSASNRIWLNGVALENVLPEARIVKRVDEGGVALRRLEFAGRSYTDVPAALIVQAGLVAAGNSVEEALAELQAFARGGGLVGAPEPETAPAAVATGCCASDASE